MIWGRLEEGTVEYERSGTHVASKGNGTVKWKTTIQPKECVCPQVLSSVKISENELVFINSIVMLYQSHVDVSSHEFIAVDYQSR